MGDNFLQRRDVLKAGALGFGGGLAASAVAAGSILTPQVAYAQAASNSLLRTVLDRGHLIVGTGSTNAPWHFEDEQGKLVGMDIAMARILAWASSTTRPKSNMCVRSPMRASQTSRPARSTSRFNL